jgi:hypothetical protein
LKLDASDGSIAVEAHSSGKLNEVERKALGKLSEAFQKSIDGLTENPPASTLPDSPSSIAMCWLRWTLRPDQDRCQGHPAAGISRR